MTILNADGSKPEMCGNGIRCVAIHLAKKQGRDVTDLTIDTDAGPLACKVQKAEVEVEMGQLVDLGPIDVTVAGRVHGFARISAGNPHAITFDRYESSEIDVIGPTVGACARFSRGVPSRIAQLADDGRSISWVWERGVGRTLACGTGATATVGAACLARRRSFGEFVEGEASRWTPAYSRARRDARRHMRGPARLVFEGGSRSLEAGHVTVLAIVDAPTWRSSSHVSSARPTIEYWWRRRFRGLPWRLRRSGLAFVECSLGHNAGRPRAPVRAVAPNATSMRSPARRRCTSAPSGGARRGGLIMMPPSGDELLSAASEVRAPAGIGQRA